MLADPHVSTDIVPSWVDDSFISMEDRIEESDNLRFLSGKEEYYVCTDDEANDLWDENLENFIDECVMHELPERCQNYFDREKFKDDCKIDGRGHAIFSYDGEEYEETVEGETYYIYRMN